jgi:hypothetical protein
VQPAPVEQPVRQLQQAEEAAAELRVRLVGDQLEQRRVAVADRRRGGALAQHELLGGHHRPGASRQHQDGVAERFRC